MCYIVDMDKIKRTAWDLAAAEFFDSTIESKGLTNKAIERVSDGRMGYNRVRDIRMGLRGPIRLSELITLCTILHISPTETLKKIIARAAEIEAAESASPVSVRGRRLIARRVMISSTVSPPTQRTMTWPQTGIRTRVSKPRLPMSRVMAGR